MPEIPTRLGPSIARSVLAASVALGAAACADQAGDVPAGTGPVTRTDSAGVEIVEISEAALEAAPTLVLEEDLRIGSVDGDPDRQLFGVAEVEVDASGVIYARDMSANSILVFGADGTILRRIGRAGEGPGEFRAEPQAHAVGPDSILVTTRFSLLAFDRLGRPLGTSRQVLTGNQFPALFTYTSAGWLLSRSERPGEELGATYRETLVVHRLDPSGPTLGPPLVSIPGRVLRYTGDGRAQSQWLSPRANAAATPGGEVYATNGDGYRVWIHAPDGRLMREIRGRMTSVPLTEDDLERALERDIARYADPAQAFGVEERRALGPLPSRPISGRILVSPAGTVLMERLDLSPIPGEPDELAPVYWDLLSSASGIVGRLEIPPSVYLQTMTDTHLYSITLDALDVQYVVRYRIVSTQG